MIFISPGHQPERTGARFRNFVEHREALIWAALLSESLDELSIENLIVPGMRVTDAAAWINRRSGPSDLAIEIHFNDFVSASGRQGGKGAETLYMPGSAAGARFATAVQGHLAHITTDRGIKEGWYRQDPLNLPNYFLRATDVPAIMIEPGFVAEAATLRAKRDEFIEVIAAGIEHHVIVLQEAA